MERYLCVHGHFYQPPRENPWLERVEVEDSAEPYHDWNARITAECYEPNTASRIMDPQGRILRISDNYSRMSFNVGPTLLAWMEAQAPEVYRQILAADHRSRETFGGHGSALAQAYNHVILPLANPRDQRTEIVWGIRDFEHRFGRPPEGLWLPETAVDLASLEICAEQGIRFVVLAPHQALRVRPLNGNAPWSDVTGGRIDPTCAYLVRLASGRSLSAFFYDGPISQAVAFGHLLDNGEELAQRLVGAFSEEGKFGRTWPQLVHIATDGETYGHHHPHGDMALAYALHVVETRSQARLTNYGEYLTLAPPVQEVEIAESTSWSCPHGVERWRSNCGCQTGLHPGWNQAWRAPLRTALDWLRDEVAPRFEEKGHALFHDPWAARDDYVQLVLDRSEPSREGFFSRHARIPLSPEQRVEALKLLELQRHSLLMYTSCGWFFDEISGLETVQVLRYAGRVIQLAEELFSVRLEPEFLERLRLARSNLPEQGDGADVYRRYVVSSRVDLGKVAAHYAISSLFEPYEPDRRIYCYRVQRGDHRRVEQGRTRLALGWVTIASETTGETGRFSYGVVHFGDHNLNAGIREFRGKEAYEAFAREVEESFSHADLAQVIRQLDEHFGGVTYSFRSLFRDEQRAILGRLIQEGMTEAENGYQAIYLQYTPFMRFLQDLNFPLPRAFQTAVEFTLNANLRRTFTAEELDLDRAEALLKELNRWKVTVDASGLGYAPQRFLERSLERFSKSPEDLRLLSHLNRAMALVKVLPYTPNLWKVQNLYFELFRQVYPAMKERAQRGDPGAVSWERGFLDLGRQLSVRVD